MMSFNMKSYLSDEHGKLRLYASIMLIISITGLFLPLAFVNELPEYLRESRLSNTLKTDLRVQATFLCCIFTTIPIIFDIILDIFSSIKNVTYGDRIPLVLMVIIPSSIFLACYQNNHIPFIFIAIFNSQFSIIVHIVLTHVAGFESYHKKFPKILYYIGIATNYSSNNCQNLSLVFESLVTRNIILIIGAILYWISVLIAILSTGNWIYHIYKAHKISPEQYNEWSICSAYIVILWIAAISSTVAISISSNSNVEEFGVVSCMIYPIYFTIIAAFLCVLPGRLIRLQAANAETTLKLKRIFVRYVSHEIRSPLNVVHAGIEYLQNKLIEYGSRHELIDLTDEIFVANESAIAILNDLLHYESIDAGRFTLDRSWKPLHHLFAKKLQPLSLLAFKSGVSLNIIDRISISDINSNKSVEDIVIMESDEQMKLRQCYLHVDIYRIDQVIRNLISNAIKFTPANSKVTISFDIEQKKHAHKQELYIDENIVGILIIKVIDMGVGIKLENQSILFQEFGQIDANTLQKGGGSGLGLWICQKIISLHNGTIQFYSEGSNKGSTFIVELPLYDKIEDNMLTNLTSETVMILKDSHKYEPLEDIMEKVSVNSSTQVKIKTSPTTPFISSRKVSNDSIDPKAVTTIICNTHQDIENNLFESSMDDTKTVEKMQSNTDLSSITLNVLIVDDSTMNRKILCRILDSAGTDFLQGCKIKIIEADDGTTAIQSLVSMRSTTSEEFDLILMDFLMVHMHGPDATYQIRQSYHFKGMIIGITGNALAEDIEIFTNSGADLVLTKPLQKQLLLDQVLNIIKKKIAQEKSQSR